MNLYKALKSAKFETKKVLQTIEKIAQKENSKEILANRVKSMLKAIESAEQGHQVLYMTNYVDFTILYLGLNVDYNKNKDVLGLIEIEEISDSVEELLQTMENTKIIIDK